MSHRSVTYSPPAGPPNTANTHTTVTRGLVVTQERDKEQEQRLARALEIISASMLPPQHTIDQIRKRIYSYLLGHKQEEAPRISEIKDIPRWKRVVLYLMGPPLDRLRSFSQYIILQIHILYNVTLMMVSIVSTPPLIFYVVGFVLFWAKVVYEMYRDVVHRDDQFHTSFLSRELALMATLSASYGVVMKFKTEAGIITEAWWSTLT
ncbi:hypothetical protein KL933_002548 [Ogataea haglerorum]|uniref:Uncharacterized protein n=1 Tax=Ogataea haglerorum TaxID=1937702 RepID=A0AAN6D5L4_9ASCO|nr:uncharacterized protein KL911_003126 [Ogataea haglerorum]KAG7695866.1 hypothetical protein KL951_003391 [Ogataea haglerorum]KAG7705710.1 hypothetical protein KL914_003548 [Ogataea haglerorum]KAG7727614.1 hypothetical protein KL933_002548 [Ogataea haglerorum]KAG7731110.1 hypothetical protein KL948_003390 [Ogataea haglerorum]KAG7737424.1 hypothetical protein KL923_003813 [Ogataea haglerorum]